MWKTGESVFVPYLAELLLRSNEDCEPPAVIDRLLWLIGSGKYVGENEKITRKKASFIQDICPILDQI